MCRPSDPATMAKRKCGKFLCLPMEAHYKQSGLDQPVRLGDVPGLWEKHVSSAFFSSTVALYYSSWWTLLHHEAHLEDLRKHAEHRMKSANDKADKRGSETYCPAFRAGLLIKIAAPTEEEGENREKMFRWEEETGMTAPMTFWDVGYFICETLGHWAVVRLSSQQWLWTSSPRTPTEERKRTPWPKPKGCSFFPVRQKASVGSEVGPVGRGGDPVRNCYCGKWHTPRHNSNRVITLYIMCCHSYFISAHILYVFTGQDAFKKMPIEMKVEEKPWSFLIDSEATHSVI